VLLEIPFCPVDSPARKNSSKTPLLLFPREVSAGNQDHIPADYLNGNLRVKGPLSLAHAAVRARLLAAKGMAYLWLLMLTLACPVAGLAQAPSEYEVKAAFLYNFAKFVDWPSGAFPSNEAPFLICVLSQNPFGNQLQQITDGKRVGGRRIQVLFLDRVRDARMCQVLFISSSERPQIKEVLESLRGSSALTVGDTTGFAQSGVAINFILEQDRVHFEINVKSAQKAGLKLSSKLLSVAKVVETSKGTGD